MSYRRFALILLCYVTIPLAVQAGPFTDQGTQPGLQYGMLPPSDCGGCHGGYDSQQNLEPWDTWAGSMMAQASRDPIFWAALDVANNDIPGVGDFCLRCHVPTGWLAGRSEPPGGDTEGCSFEGKMDEMNKDLDGLSCHVCHRMMINPNPPQGEESMYLENGQFWIDDSDCNGMGEPCRRGNYDYPADGQEAPHAWAFSPYHESSDNCGNCHNVTHPVTTLVEDGVDTGIPFPIERTYREWLLSEFSDPGSPDHLTCQNCHMPDATANPAYACDDQTNNHSGDLPIHQLAGGNSWIPEVLRLEYPNLGLNSELAATRDWALQMLQNESALVELSAPDSVTQGSDLPVTVRVTNLTGHKLPTGYPEGRRMWINLQVRDETNALLFESCAYDLATGILTEDAQAKVYEAKPGIWNRNGTNECDCDDASGSPIFHFVLNDCIEKDNRIPPLGFTGGNDPEVKPVGYVYPETSPGSGVLVNWDETLYQVPIPGDAQGALSVTAVLRYQTISREHVEFLRDQAVENGFPDDCIERSSGFPTQSRGEILYEMWEAHDRSAPVAMGTATASVTATEGGTPAQEAGLASTTVLRQNHPNPVRPEDRGTRIAYRISTEGPVRMEVFDTSGRLVRKLVDGRRGPGAHSVLWDGRDEAGRPMAAGVYLYVLHADGLARTKKLIMLR